MNNADDETNAKDSLDFGDRCRKVLGVNWNTTADKFVFEFSDIINITSKLKLMNPDLSNVG